MIRVEQIRLLETKVQKAVSFLSSLQEENSLLKTRLGEYEKRVDDLEYLLEEFKEEQQEIEQGIISALNKLETLETAAKQSQEPLNNQSIPKDPASKVVHNTDLDQKIHETVTLQTEEPTTSVLVDETNTETEPSESSIENSEDSEFNKNHKDLIESSENEIHEEYQEQKPPELDIF